MNNPLTEDAKRIQKKWEMIVEDKDADGDSLGFGEIKDYTKKKHVARLLENTEQVLKETTNQTSGMDIVDPILINLVRRTAPNLLAYDLVGVQPMSGPTGTIFAMRAHYGAQPTGPFGRPGDGRTGFGAGSALDGAGNTVAQDWGLDGIAPNEAFKNEANTVYSGTGTQTSNATAPDYTAYSVGVGITTAAAETMGRGLTGDDTWNEMSFTIDKTTVEAKARQLKASYSREVEHDLKAVHGLDAATEIGNILSTEILAETNREIVNRIRQTAKIAVAEKTYSNGSVLVDSNGAAVLGVVGLFDLDVNSDGRWSNEKHKSLLMKINKEANAIAKDTRRGRGNFIVCSSDVAAALDLTGKMVYAPAIDNNLNVDDTGNTFVGMLQGRYKVYIDPYLGYDEVIVGYKGANQMDAGMFYCPYVPLQKREAVDPATMQPVMAFQTRYGVVANPFTTLTRNQNSYYRKFKVQNL